MHAKLKYIKFKQEADKMLRDSLEMAEIRNLKIFENKLTLRGNRGKNAAECSNM